MAYKLLSAAGVLAAVFCLGTATCLYPGGFHWDRDYVSTLLRGPAGAARALAELGVLLFCISLAATFERLARRPEYGFAAKGIRIGGIGSMVYAALTITPLHDLMVTMSLGFLMVALVSLLIALRSCRTTGYFIFGCAGLTLLTSSAAVYYSGYFVRVLPWAQRISFSLLALWLICLDFRCSSFIQDAEAVGR